METDDHRCGLCARPLRDPASVELGFGPDCWSRLDATARSSVYTPRAAVVETLPVGPSPSTAERAEAPVVGSVHQYRRVGSPLAVAGAWAVVLAAVLVLLEYWRFVLVGVAFVGLAAVAGLIVDHYRHRRLVGREPPPAR